MFSVLSFYSIYKYIGFALRKVISTMPECESYVATIPNVYYELTSDHYFNSIQTLYIVRLYTIGFTSFGHYVKRKKNRIVQFDFIYIIRQWRQHDQVFLSCFIVWLTNLTLFLFHFAIMKYTQNFLHLTSIYKNI